MEEPVTIHIPPMSEAEGAQASSEPTNGTASWYQTVPDSGTSTLAITYQTEQTGVEPEATVTMTGLASNRQESKTVTRSLSIGTVGTVREHISLSAFAPGSSVNVTVQAKNVNTRFEVSSRKDTDGDGLWDSWERQTFFYTKGGDDVPWEFSTSVTDPDTDDDGLSDGEEYEVVRHAATEEMDTSVLTANATAHPEVPDTNGDGVSDGTEVHGWTIEKKGTLAAGYGTSTTARPATLNASLQNGTVHNGTVQNESVQTETTDSIEAQSVDQAGPQGSDELHVTADPLQADTDGDGLTDSEENITHTDPREELTYAVAGEPRGLVTDIKNGEQPVVYPPDHRSPNTPTRHFYDVSYWMLNLQQPESSLTDATADYDFVLDGSAPKAGEGTYTVTEAREKLTFTALDGTTRTDVSMSNAVEIKHGLDPWDPDSDDDGLTDGQEHNWLTHVPVDTGYVARHEVTHDRSLDLDPSIPDTDGDGYWDGWIGVHGVGDSENVILYREHLQDGNGIEGDEIVTKQAGIHPVPDDHPGAYIDIEPPVGTKYHSNIHVGELHWRDYDPSQTADPAEASLEPNPELTVEVDYHSSVATTGIVNESLEKAERTYQLYGLDITYVKDQNITKTYPSDGNVNWENLKKPNPVLAGDNEDENHDIEDSAYMFITYDGGGGGNRLVDQFDWTDDPSGVASCQGADLLCDQWAGGKMNFGTIVFHKDIAQDSGPYGTYATKTMVHETGHLIGAGRNDDEVIAGILPEEVYSGTRDDTPEYVKLDSDETKRWSVMCAGWTSEILNPPASGEYIPYSVEELLTIEFNGIDARK